MNYHGAMIGLAAFLIIGIFHPIISKTEFHINMDIWPAHIIIGLVCIALSLFIDDVLPSATLTVKNPAASSGASSKEKALMEVATTPIPHLSSFTPASSYRVFWLYPIKGGGLLVEHLGPARTGRTSPTKLVAQQSGPTRKIACSLA
jgi:hypothetical protein